ncbi:hypothetical protein EUGRSUZ_H00500 [Eucalyptus grandis]|uniref:Uncharacterized protein n=2 Tax=Eucalyptus grandis TaxID=71139 RepID=A0ACC3JKS5_EUCGR|nr:hypothetical protein EUGRSUZ_H00500 [Eucalyptus grandis]
MFGKAHLVFLLFLALSSDVIISSKVAVAARLVSNGGSRSGVMAVSKIGVGDRMIPTAGIQNAPPSPSK